MSRKEEKKIEKKEIKLVTIEINEKKLKLLNNKTIMQACKILGFEIPRFCYHEQLSIAGNCRMCLLELIGSPKPIVSCSRNVGDKMAISTKSSAVKKMREEILEFLLINHPLDCPICDQGGECDLQEQTMVYGNDRSRFFEYKRAVEDKNCGPLIKTIMTRCIQCTRCVRFISEIAGTNELGVMGRGQNMEIGTYIKHLIKSELSGNVIDLCPVGALTSKPYAFKARPWELQNTESIDILDAIGSNIRIDVRGSEILRILPLFNERINEEWISDKSRFAFDGLNQQRLTTPLLKQNGNFVPITWKKVFGYLKNIFDLTSGGRTIQALVGNLTDTETIVAVQDLYKNLGSANISCLEANWVENLDLRTNYLLNTTLEQIKKADLCLLLGVNPRLEGSLLNVKLKKQVKTEALTVMSIGAPANLTYKHYHLGNTTKTLLKIAEGRHVACQLLKKAKKPLLIIGGGFLSRKDNLSIFQAIKVLIKNIELLRLDWKGLNILQNAVNSAGSLELGIKKQNIYQETKYIPKILYLLGVDDLNLSQYRNKSFIIYQGHTGDYSAQKADLILPGYAFTEKESTYINTEGFMQTTNIALNSVSTNMREDWKILKALSLILEKPLIYDSTPELFCRINTLSPIFSKLSMTSRTECSELYNNTFYNKINKSKIFNTHFESTITNFYMTDSISRASPTMAQCTNEFIKTSLYNYIK